MKLVECSTRADEVTKGMRRTEKNTFTIYIRKGTLYYIRAERQKKWQILLQEL